MYKLLEGVRILDLTSVVLGPFVTQILGDLGADVIKVESPDGDIFRGVSPERSPNMGSGFLNINRNKRSIVLDIKTAAGKTALERLVAKSDVFIHNMRPSAIKKLGLTYSELSSINSSIVYCSAIGFGSEGPYADKPAYDDIIQSISGFANLSKTESGEPRFVPTVLADKIGGFYSLYGILSALYYRSQTGEGVEVEAPMFEGLASFVFVEHLQGRIFNPPVGEAGYKRLTSPFRRPYRTSDGYIAVMPYSSKHWNKFFNLVGRHDLADADWVRNSASRSQRISELYQVVDEEIAKKSTLYWTKHLEEIDVPCSAVNSLDDLFDNPHLKAVSFFQEMDHPTEGRMMTTRQPVTVKGAISEEDTPAPSLGQHSKEILMEAGFSSVDIQEMIDSGSVRVASAS